MNENVNIIGRIIRGEVIYECIQTIVSNKEIVVYYDLKNFDLNTTTTTLFHQFYPSLFAVSPFFRTHHHHAFICRQALQGRFFVFFFVRIHPCKKFIFIFNFLPKRIQNNNNR